MTGLTSSARGLTLEAHAYRLLARGLSAQRQRRRGAAAPTGADLNTENVQAAAAKLGVQAELLGNGFLQLSYQGRVSYARSADFEFERLVPWLVCGDKWLTARLLSERGLPVPTSGAFTASRFAEAGRFFDSLSKPVVTKPARGTASGTGITLDITTRRQLHAGFVRARAYGSEVLVEQQVPGENVRVTILDGQVLGAVRRLPAHVVGDGHRTLSALVQHKNDLWHARSPHNRLFRPIELDDDVNRTLGHQGLTLQSVPGEGQVVHLRRVSNADAAACGPVLAGVDLITTDPSAPVRAGEVFINEINTTPGLYVANGLQNGSPSTYASECILRRLFGIEA
jgi:cyanophycin synthetase